MADEQYHKLHPDEFEEAFMVAVGAYVGHMIAKEGVGPMWTEARNEAFRHATEEAWNAGYRAAVKELTDDHADVERWDGGAE